MHQTCVCVLQKEVGVMYVQLSSVSSRLGSRLSLMVQVNLVLNTCRAVVVDSDWCSDNLCGSHRLSQSEFYHVTWWYYTLVIDLIGQLRRDVIGCLSVKPWCHWLWRLVKLLLKWLLGSNLSQLYLAACENSTISTFKTLQVSSCWWEVSVSKGKGMEWVHFNFPPPLLPTDATGPLLCWPIISNEVNEWKKYCFILNSTDCVINYCSLLTAITTKKIIHQI